MSSSDKFTQEALRYSRSASLFAPGLKVLVACSGGLDSSVLVHWLASVSRLLEIEIEIAHVDHRARGATSEREATWVRVLAERLGLPWHSLTLAGVGNSQGEWRDLRRRALSQLASDLGAGAIATAHHADDNAETFLMRAMSGTGSRGLSGIPAQDGLWVRPLLWATRAELEAYARGEGLAWVEDPSNARADYLRNRLRLDVLPKIEEARAGSVRNLARLAERLEAEEKEIDGWLGSLLEESRKGWLSLGWLERWPKALQRRALGLWIRRQGVDYDPLLVETLLKGEEVIHPAGSFLRRSDALVFTPESDFGAPWSSDALRLDLGRRVSLGASMAWSFLPGAPARLCPFELGLFAAFRDPRRAVTSRTALALDWSSTPWPLAVRTARAEERAALDIVLRRAGIPRPYWKNWPVLASAADPSSPMIAAVGLEALERYRVKPSGRCVFVDAVYEERLSALSPS